MKPMLSEDEAIQTYWNWEDPKLSEARFRALLTDYEAPDHDAQRTVIKTQIARAQGLQGNFDAAYEMLEDIRPALRAQHPIVDVRYLLEYGRLLNTGGEPARATPYFLEGWRVARKYFLDFHAVDAAHMLGITLPVEQQQEWTQNAIAVAQKSSDERTQRWLGSLYNNLGWSLHDAGDFEQALLRFEEALTWQKEHATPDKVHVAQWAVARCQRSLGNTQLAFDLQLDLLTALEHAQKEDGYVYEELGECALILAGPKDAAPHFAKAHALLAKATWLVKQEPERIARLRALSKS